MNQVVLEEVAGYRLFECVYCTYHWKNKHKNCRSLAAEECPKCGMPDAPTSFERHYEWPVNQEGKLL